MASSSLGVIKTYTSESDTLHTPNKMKKAGRKKGSRNKSPTFTIMQWNQKELTLLCSVEEAKAAKGRRQPLLDNPKYEQSIKRVENIVRTIINSGPMIGNNKQGPAACVIEEVRTGGGGERAIKYIKDELNDHFEGLGHSLGAWKAQLSGEVNPFSGKKEHYVIIWNSDLLGDLVNVSDYRLMPEGFKGCGGSRDDEKQIDKYDLLIGKAEIDLTRVRKIWEKMNCCQLGWHANARFDRMPALFSFKPDAFPQPLHIIAVHGATGAHFKSPHQNITETMFLQEICGQAAAAGEYVILLGDFNLAEENNRTERLWDGALALYEPGNDAIAGSDVDENYFLSQTKGCFLKYFKRGVPAYLPTNVYPFLAGGNATPKHNDDIWLPKMDTFLDIGQASGTQGRLGSKQPGKIHEIPDYVLRQWEKTTREYFGTLTSSHLQSASKHRLNELLSKVWSDHRPISVDLKLRKPGLADHGGNTTRGAAETDEGMYMAAANDEVYDAGEPLNE